MGKKVTRPSWDKWALGLAEAVSRRADCTRSQVGAVLLSRSHRVLGVGYNGLISGVPGCATMGNCPRGRLSYDEVPADSDYSNCPALHAEQNCLLHSDPREFEGATLYVTRTPCPGCQTLIDSCGITRVVTPEPRCTHLDTEVVRNAAGRYVAVCDNCGYDWEIMPRGLA